MNPGEVNGVLHFNSKRIASFVAALAVALLIWIQPLGLQPQAHAVLAIMFFAGVLWFTEALPLWVTALMVPPLLVIFAGSAPKDVYTPFFDPIIALLFGGFVLARALQKHGLDTRIAYTFVGLFGNKPKNFLLGMMLATAFLSFWISNTASTLLMIPIGLAALTATGLAPLKSGYARTVVLGIGYAATIGGVGTLIGTPPNLIAARFLGDAGIQVGFLDWVVHAMPPVIVMLFLSWFVLTRMFRPEIKTVKAPEMKDRRLTGKQKTVLAVFVITALLWVTDSFHGIHNSVVAMLPVAAFYMLNILDSSDLPKIGWNALILVGGGLTLGSAIHSTGLDVFIASLLNGFIAGQPTFLLFLLVSLFSIGFTAFVANTAGAAILIPIIISLSNALGLDPRAMAILVGITVSFDFIVPVGTPPNAIAYSTGYIRVKDMIKAGIVLSLLGALVASGFAMLW